MRLRYGRAGVTGAQKDPHGGGPGGAVGGRRLKAERAVEARGRGAAPEAGLRPRRVDAAAQLTGPTESRPDGQHLAGSAGQRQTAECHLTDPDE